MTSRARRDCGPTRDGRSASAQKAVVGMAPMIILAGRVLIALSTVRALPRPAWRISYHAILSQTAPP